MEHLTPQESPNETPNQPNILDVWNDLKFEGKQYCKLEENGTLLLLASAQAPQRILTTITVQNAAAVVQALSEKFKEVNQKAEEAKAEIEAFTEPFKGQGKLQRLKSYLLNANAIGDYQPFLAYISVKEEEYKTVLKANETIRESLVNKAISLKDSDEYKNTTEAYRLLIEEWKKAPQVDKDVQDKLWNTIELARNEFYERKRAYQESVERDLMQNLDLKLELCEKAEALSHSDAWRETSEVYKQLMESWKGIGRVASPEKNDELWNRFIQAKNGFYDRKAAHQSQILVEQEANYAAKLALVEQAEAIKDQTTWKETADVYAKILEDWKQIGKVPFEKADELWNRMQVAKDHFFNAKRTQAESYKVNLEDNYAQKKALVDRVETIKLSNDWKETTEEVNELLATWKTIGPIPREYGDSLWEQFIAARQLFFKRKDEDREARKSRFEQQINNRLQQSRQFLATIETELEEDESKLIEFKEILANTTDGDAKDREIKSNLERLVEQIERKMPNRKSKIEDVKIQIAELEQRLNSEK